MTGLVLSIGCIGAPDMLAAQVYADAKPRILSVLRPLCVVLAVSPLDFLIIHDAARQSLS